MHEVREEGGGTGERGEVHKMRGWMPEVRGESYMR